MLTGHFHIMTITVTFPSDHVNRKEPNWQGGVESATQIPFLVELHVILY